MPDDSIATVQQEPIAGRAIPRLSDDASPADFGAGLGVGLESAAQDISAVQQMHDRTQAISANSAITDWKNNALYQGLDPNQKGADAIYEQQGLNAVNLPARYLPQFDNQVKQIGSTLNPRAAQAFAAHAAQERSEFNLQLNRYEFEQGQRTAQIVNNDANAVTIKDAALGWRDPQIMQRSRDRLSMQASAEAVRQGFPADSPEAQAIHDQLVGSMHAAVVRQMVSEGQTAQASDYLYANINEMDLKQGESLQALMLNREAHDQVVANRQLKQGSDALAKQGDDLQSSGKLTADWLHANRELFEPAEYRHFTDILNGKEESANNPKVYSDLLLAAQQGQDVSGSARTAYLHGQINKSAFDSVTRDVASERPGYAKRGAEYLSQALDPGQLNPDPAAHQSRANGLADWDEWVQGHPKATDNEARAAMESIAQHYQIVSQDRTTLLMPAPKYLVGTRINPDLAATSKNTIAALQRGEITMDQAQREARLIAQYGSTLKAQADAQAAADAKRKAKQ